MMSCWGELACNPRDNPSLSSNPNCNPSWVSKRENGRRLITYS